MSKSEKIIQIKGLTKRYGSFVAVKGIDLEIYKGEIFGFLGPNGAGKTTTLEIIETLRDETEGDVIVDGYSINKDKDKIKSIIGIQLQSAGFYPKLKLTEILNLFAGLYDVQIDPLEVLDKVQLRDKANSVVEKLSGGQKQRFSIATTLVHNPKIIFLDEPSTGLDPQARMNLWDLIKSINLSGTTVVLTTHYMEEAEMLCNRVAVMNEGKILQVGSPKDLVNDLLKTGFKKEVHNNLVNLEDVFINLTGKDLRE